MSKKNKFIAQRLFWLTFTHERKERCLTDMMREKKHYTALFDFDSPQSFTIIQRYLYDPTIPLKTRNRNHRCFEKLLKMACAPYQVVIILTNTEINRSRIEILSRDTDASTDFKYLADHLANVTQEAKIPLLPFKRLQQKFKLPYFSLCEKLILTLKTMKTTLSIGALSKNVIRQALNAALCADSLMQIFSRLWGVSDCFFTQMDNLCHTLQTISPETLFSTIPNDLSLFTFEAYQGEPTEIRNALLILLLEALLTLKEALFFQEMVITLMLHKPLTPQGSEIILILRSALRRSPHTPCPLQIKLLKDLIRLEPTQTLEVMFSLTGEETFILNPLAIATVILDLCHQKKISLLNFFLTHFTDSSEVPAELLMGAITLKLHPPEKSADCIDFLLKSDILIPIPLAKLFMAHLLSSVTESEPLTITNVIHFINYCQLLLPTDDLFTDLQNSAILNTQNDQALENLGVVIRAAMNRLSNPSSISDEIETYQLILIGFFEFLHHNPEQHLIRHYAPLYPWALHHHPTLAITILGHPDPTHTPFYIHTQPSFFRSPKNKKKVRIANYPSSTTPMNLFLK